MYQIVENFSISIAKNIFTRLYKNMKISTNYSLQNSPYKSTTFKSAKKTVIKQSLPVTISILGAGCATIINGLERVKKIMDEREKFVNLREELSEKLEPVKLEAARLDWDFYINSTQENMEKMQVAWDKYQSVFADKEAFDKFKEINSELLLKHDAKQLKDILKEFDEEINSGEEKKALRDKESEIAQKYNSYVPKIDGREVSKAAITKILQTEVNEKVRKEAYDAKIKGGDLIADDLREFVKMRNEYAKTKGFNNYFEYMLKDTYDVDAEFLEKLTDEVYSQAKDKIKKLQDKKYIELKKYFGKEKLEPYHYGLLLDSNPSKRVNEVLEEVAKEHPKIIEEISKKTYEGMGYDVDKMLENGSLVWDLYPRKGKNTHGFCFDIEAGKDARILANLTNNVTSIDTLNHEMGHSVYTLGISADLPYFDRDAASAAVTEAVAMMMGDLVKTEDIMKEYLSSDELKIFKDSFPEDEAGFVSRALLIINFEREFYKNPDEDPKLIWKILKQKYLNRDEEADNEWATIPHYLSHPAYYQNYFRATLMKAQIYKHLRSLFGNITENTKTANYLNENIFKLGASIDEYELIKQLTGKEFSAKDFSDKL